MVGYFTMGEAMEISLMAVVSATMAVGATSALLVLVIQWMQRRLFDRRSAGHKLHERLMLYAGYPDTPAAMQLDLRRAGRLVESVYGSRRDGMVDVQLRITGSDGGAMVISAVHPLDVVENEVALCTIANELAIMIAGGMGEFDGTLLPHR